MASICLHVPCPVCEVLPGVPCRSLNDGPLRASHLSRLLQVLPVSPEAPQAVVPPTYRSLAIREYEDVFLA